MNWTCLNTGSYTNLIATPNIVDRMSWQRMKSQIKNVQIEGAHPFRRLQSCSTFKLTPLLQIRALSFHRDELEMSQYWIV